MIGSAPGNGPDRGDDRFDDPIGDRAAEDASRRRWSAAALPLALLAGCLVLAFVLLETGPVAERGPAPQAERVVEVVPVRKSRGIARIEAMGTVVPARQIVLQPQVGGLVVDVAPEFVPGGRFAAGEVMIRIEPRDYALALRRAESELTQARSELRLEVGNQSVAELEYGLLGETIAEADRDLVLRQPQLESVRARVESAEAAVAQARLDLERTVVRAPFDSLVRTRGIDLGARVDPATPVATLVDTSAYWVEVLIPVSQLAWIETARTAEAAGVPGSPALVSIPGAPPGSDQREGHAFRLLADLEAEGRMARLLVRVDDPISLRPEHAGRPPLLLDSFVHVSIEGRSLEDVVAIDRALLREGDRAWVLDAGGRLAIRELEIAFRGEDHVLVSEGLADGELVVRSDLTAPVAGMALRTAPPDLSAPIAAERKAPRPPSPGPPKPAAATPAPLPVESEADAYDRG
ncbi:MAG: efflux RND transporter periplasmic adaptor subunit [Myxococcota bacterium]